MLRRYSSPATEPRPSEPFSIACTSAGPRPAFSRAVTRYRISPIVRRLVSRLLPRTGNDWRPTMSRKRSHWLLALACAAGLLLGPMLSAQTAGEQVDTVMALLDCIDRLAANARKDAKAGDLEPIGATTAEGATVTVTMRAADLDEIRAEIAQIKLLLQ